MKGKKKEIKQYERERKSHITKQCCDNSSNTRNWKLERKKETRLLNFKVIILATSH